jgi:hypothetical protein
MIAIARAVPYGANIINYAMGKSMAKVLKLNQFEKGTSYASIWDLMLIHQAKTAHLRDQRKPLKNNVIKMEISPKKSESLGWSDEDWRNFLEEFIEIFDGIDLSAKTNRASAKSTNLKNSQYVAAIHYDSKSTIPHIHLVANRVDCNGQTNDDHRISERVMMAARIMNERRGWELPEEISADRKAQITEDCMNVLRSMPAFDWNLYSSGLNKLGYKVTLRRDKTGNVVGYSVKVGNSNYKASVLADTKKLNASNIKKTWQSLHAEKKSGEKIRSINGTSGISSSKSHKIPSVQPGVAPVVSPKFIPQRINVGYKEYKFDIPQDAYNIIKDNVSLPGDNTTANIEDAAKIAMLLFAEYVDGATTVADNCGGGGTSCDNNWGRNPDEDDKKWAFRCAQQASQMCKPRSYKFRRR